MRVVWERNDREEVSVEGRFEKPTELGRIMETLVGEQSTDGYMDFS